MKSLIFYSVIIMFSAFLTAQTKFNSINLEIEKGNFKLAKELINKKLSDENLTDTEKYNLNFQIDVLNRIERDFKKNRDDIKNQLSKYFPTLTDSMLDKWEVEKSLEMKIINGKKRYFNNAVPNLFRINKETASVKQNIDGTYHNSLNEFLKKHLPVSVDEFEDSENHVVNPQEMKLHYTLTVDADAVPDGEIIHCWLPYPKENFQRQKDVKLLSVNDEEYIISSDSNPQRTLYLEKKAEKGKPTKFEMEFEYTAYSEVYNIDPEKVKPYDKNSELYKKFTSERAPHIVFTNELKELSNKIVGDTKNPYEKVFKIFQWISKNIPWASAREYSTIKDISSYCINNMHGDCGIKAMTFITLARLNGIPARWQSGWMLHPGNVNLHDWAEYYLEGYGWIPIDVDYGIQNSDNPKVKYYYASGIDSYRLIVNSDFGKPLFPAKIYPRSETNDFQRGEVEWRGGNLYFDKWNYHMEVKYENEKKSF